ncbi:MAG: ABC transporter substrate-binding protein [Acidobacteriota bacterium]
MKSPVAITLTALTAIALVATLGCQEKESAVFGAVLPLTGASGIYGEPIKKGIELAFEQLQQLPDAPEMGLEIADSQSDPEVGAQALAELYQNGIRAGIGGVTTPEAHAMIKVADENYRVLLSPSASSEGLPALSRNFYRIWPSDTREGGKMGQYAAQNLNLESAVILAAETPYASGIQQVFVESFENSGGAIPEVITYPESSTVDDLPALIERALAHEPQGLFLADYADGVVSLIQAIRAAGFEGSLLTVSAFATPQALAAAGAEAEGVLVTHPQYSPDDENEDIQAFVEAYQAKYGEVPGIYAAHGYDVMKVLYEALINGGESGPNFWKGIVSIEEMQGVTGPIQFDDRGDVQKWPRVYFLKEGKLVDHEMWRQEQIEQIRKRREELERQQRDLQRRIRNSGSGGSR